MNEFISPFSGQETPSTGGSKHSPAFFVRPMTGEDAAAIAAWQYPAPYAMYGMDESCIPELTGGSYFAVHMASETGLADGPLAGYFCFGLSAQVPAGHFQGAYADESLTDIGLGLHPGLCGLHLGADFLKCILAYAQSALGAEGFRLTVADFNSRAKKTYEKAGFKKTGSFLRPGAAGGMMFDVMVRR